MCSYNVIYPFLPQVGLGGVSASGGLSLPPVGVDWACGLVDCSFSSTLGVAKAPMVVDGVLNILVYREAAF